MKVNFVKGIIGGIIACVLLSSAGFSDEGCGVEPTRKLTPYPGSVSSTDGQTPPYKLRLSKDRQQDVRKYYADQKKSGDFIQEQKDGGFTVENIFQRKTACGKPTDALLLRIMERTSDEPSVGQAFVALKAMTTMGMHSEAEYQQAVKQYGASLKAFFRTVNVPDGNQADEGRLILDKYRKLEKQQRGAPTEGTPQDKERATDLRKKMQEMKARGDYAGMQQLAMQYQGKAQGDSRVQQAKKDMNRDMWPLWLQCLKEMREAAYLTRLDYDSIQGD